MRYVLVLAGVLGILAVTGCSVAKKSDGSPNIRVIAAEASQKECVPCADELLYDFSVILEDGFKDNLPGNFCGYDVDKNTGNLVLYITDEDTSPYQYIVDQLNYVEFKSAIYSIAELQEIAEMYIKDNPEVPVVDYSVPYSGNSKNISITVSGDYYEKNLAKLEKSINGLPIELHNEYLENCGILD